MAIYNVAYKANLPNHMHTGRKISRKVPKYPYFNKGLAPSFNVARVGFANLPFSRGLYPLLNGKWNPPPKRRGTSCLSYNVEI